MIVDDEPLAQSLIEKFIKRVPYLVLSATYDNAIEAKHGVDVLKPDMVFLDVNMPEMTGIEFLKSFVGNRPNIIFTTAHQQYAYEGFEYDAVDYLLKPVAFDRFMKAIYKVEERLRFTPEEMLSEPASDVSTVWKTKNLLLTTDSDTNMFFLIKVDKKLVNVAFSDIVYVEGMKDYVKIHLADHFFITHMTMARIMSLLPAQFMRINRSFIIQTALMKHIEGNMITMSNGERLTIGSSFLEPVKETIKKWTVQ